jgi:hypothetical protein
LAVGGEKSIFSNCHFLFQPSHFHFYHAYTFTTLYLV